jgi:outer membrane receptor for ferrienterochelin and colicin
MLLTAEDGQLSLLSSMEVSLTCQKRPDQPLTAVTDDNGLLLFADAAPDRCQIKLSTSDFEEQIDTIDLMAGQTMEHNFQVRIRHLEQSVNVTAEAPRAIDTTSTSTSAPAISQDTLQSAPLVNDRFEDALPLIPGVVRGPDGLMDIKGGRPDQSSTLVNSVSAADPVTGREAISLPLDAVDSVNVRSSPFLAEYGNFSSGVTEVETRSGSDQWKFLFTNFMVRPRFRTGTIMGVDSGTPRLTFAGPLVKGKVYLFQSFDYRFERTAVGSLPPLQRDQSFETFDSSTRLDWNLSNRNHLTGNFLWYPENVRYDLLNTFLPEQSNPDFRRRGYLVSLKDNTFFENALLESSFSAKRYDVHVFPASGTAGEFVYYPEQDSGSWFDRQDRQSRLEQWSETYRVGQLKGYGDHSVAVGSAFIHQSFDGQVTNEPVTVEREDHTVSQIIDFSGPARLNADSNLFSFFAQDHWTPVQHLSLDFGVRGDHDTLSHDALNVAPRVGFVIAPTKDNRLVRRIHG